MQIRLNAVQELQVKKIVKIRQDAGVKTCPAFVARELVSKGLDELKKNPGELSLWA